VINALRYEDEHGQCIATVGRDDTVAVSYVGKGGKEQLGLGTIVDIFRGATGQVMFCVSWAVLPGQWGIRRTRDHYDREVFQLAVPSFDTLPMDCIAGPVRICKTIEEWEQCGDPFAFFIFGLAIFFERDGRTGHEVVRFTEKTISELPCLPRAAGFSPKRFTDLQMGQGWLAWRLDDGTILLPLQDRPGHASVLKQPLGSRQGELYADFDDIRDLPPTQSRQMIVACHEHDRQIAPDALADGQVVVVSVLYKGTYYQTPLKQAVPEIFHHIRESTWACPRMRDRHGINKMRSLMSKSHQLARTGTSHTEPFTATVPADMVDLSSLSFMVHLHDGYMQGGLYYSRIRNTSDLSGLAGGSEFFSVASKRARKKDGGKHKHLYYNEFVLWDSVPTPARKSSQSGGEHALAELEAVAAAGLAGRSASEPETSCTPDAEAEPNEASPLDHLPSPAKAAKARAIARAKAASSARAPGAPATEEKESRNGCGGVADKGIKKPRRRRLKRAEQPPHGMLFFTDLRTKMGFKIMRRKWKDVTVDRDGERGNCAYDGGVELPAPDYKPAAWGQPDEWLSDASDCDN